MTRILLAPAAPPAESFGSSLKSFMDDPILKPQAPAPKEPDGKTNAPERPGNVAPADKPGVADPAPAKDAGAPASKPAGDDKGGGGPADAAPATAKADTEAKPAAAPAKEDWETAAAPKTNKEWDKWRQGRKEKETALRTEIQTRDTQLQELQTKLAEAEQKASASAELPPETQERLKALEAENKELHQRFMETEVTADPKFAAYFKNKFDSAIKMAKQAVGQERAEQVEKIMKLQDPEFKQAKIEEFLSELESDYQKGLVTNAVSRYAEIEEEREQEIGKAKSLREQKQAQDSTRQEQAVKVRDDLFNRTLKAKQDPKTGFAPFQLKDGDNAWNQGVAKRVEYAKALLTGEGVKPDAIVEAVFQAASLGPVLQAYQHDLQQWKTEREGLQAKIDDLAKGLPAGGESLEGEDARPEHMRFKKDDDPAKVMQNFAASAAKMARGG